MVTSLCTPRVILAVGTLGFSLQIPICQRPSNDKGPGIPAFNNCHVLKMLRDINYRLTKWGSSADHRGVVGPVKVLHHALRLPTLAKGEGMDSEVSLKLQVLTKVPFRRKGLVCKVKVTITLFLSIFTILQLPLTSTASTQSGGPVNTTGPSVPGSSTASTSTAPPSNQLALDSQGTRLHTKPPGKRNYPPSSHIQETDYMGIWLAFGMHPMLAMYILTTGTSQH
ncbi:hypothetical protein K439DRAFT_1613577 [Ramaria rubella]|nr:hypothetical protein K439DRAFT_1613577 [Ramaria rubella]